MNRKGVEIGINAIVIAAFALIVLLVLMMLFSGQIGELSRKYLGITDVAIDNAKGTKPCGGFMDPNHMCSKKSTISKSEYNWVKLGQGEDFGCAKSEYCFERTGLKNKNE